MPSLFRKKKLDKELSSNTDGNQRKTQKVNGIPVEENPGDEYFDVNIFSRLSLPVGITVLSPTSRFANVHFANV